jgi:transcriptional regulator with XRE-family HTH domain
MPFKEIITQQLAQKLGVNYQEVKQKQSLIDIIIEIRKAKRMSQATLAKKMDLTQSRLVQIESGVGTAKVPFEVLFNVLQTLGYSVEFEQPGD